VTSSTERRGLVFLATTMTELATSATPLDVWPAGDTGSVRTTLLRAHPVLSHGRLRTDRLGRLVSTATGEAQRWWRVAGPVRAAAALFLDTGQTAKTVTGPSRFAADLGVGARFSAAIVPGIFRIDLAHALRDDEFALSFVYQP
jgi:hypothetical protein